LRSDIMKFKQFDNENIAQAWERIVPLMDWLIGWSSKPFL
jgi:hypothetical protein